MAFLDKLKGKIEEAEEKDTSQAKELTTSEKSGDDKMSGYMQLNVDIYKTSREIIIFAPIAGVEIKDLDIYVENENDVITIQGKRFAPALEMDVDKDKVSLRQECEWGSFYRQVILPEEIDVEKISAKLKKNVLILRMPLLRIHIQGKKKITIKTD